MAQPDQAVSTGPGRLERRKARTRASIVEAATALFQDQGYDETAIQQIAERADTGVGTLYGYFPSKEDILKEVLRQNSAEAVEHYLAAVNAETPAIDRICKALATFAEYIRENRTVLMAAFQIAARNRRIDEAPMEWLAGAYGSMIREGIAAGTIKPVPVETTARVLVATYLQAMLGIGVWNERQDDPATDRELEIVVRTLLVA